MGINEARHEKKCNDDSALRMIGPLLAEQNEVWQERRYLDVDEFAQWTAERAAPVMAITLLPSPAKTKYVIEPSEVNLQKNLDLTCPA